MTTGTMTKLISGGKEICLDRYYRRITTERDICNTIYQNPELDISAFNLVDPSLHNSAISVNYSELSTLEALQEIAEEPEDWHRKNQNSWMMPNEYKNFNLYEFLLEQCSNDIQIKRVNEEFAEFEKRNLLDLLRYIKYLVDTMTKNNVVWGIGRGSSVASYVLYLIGIHSVDSIKHNLDFYEFMR